MFEPTLLPQTTLFTADFQPPSPARLPQYMRAVDLNVPPMRLTERDGRILEAIHAFDGLLSDQQIKRLFFRGTSQMQLRMRLLYQHGYVVRPDRRRRTSLSEMVYWLDTKGAAYVAGLSGVPLDEFSFRREPKWMQLGHDLAVNDVRMTVMEACTPSSGFTLEEWIPQSEFWAHPDRVDFTLPNGKKASRHIRPDGFCLIRQGTYYSRLLIELDKASEDNPRIGREKILPGIAYLRSDAYRKRFGYTSGRWLFITTSDRRLSNLKRQTEIVAGNDAKLFFFTTLDRVAPTTVFAAPMWWRGGEDAPSSLFTP
jgi:hypothetical protein